MGFELKCTVVHYATINPYCKYLVQKIRNLKFKQLRYIFLEVSKSFYPRYYSIKQALINLRHHSVTFELYKAILLINIWNKYVSASESYPVEPVV